MKKIKKEFINLFKNKRILITGGTGFIGSGIVKKLLEKDPRVIRVFSNDEDTTFQMRQELDDKKNLRFLIGDIRDKERLIRAMEDIHIVYHAAALKHVPLCEYNPNEAIKTNVLGTQNVIEAAIATNVKKVINISTDKAVNPINTMGATKLLAEKLTIDANYYKGTGKTIFSCVRFGNVLYSRGSVLPLFEKQIIEKKHITITNPQMTRFIMSLSNTIDLVFKATEMAKGGEIFILKMPVTRLDNLANAAIEKYSKKHRIKEPIHKKIIGLRAGEKMFEELMTEIEAKKAFETKDMLIIPPETTEPDMIYKTSDYTNAKLCKMHHYTSKNVKLLTKKELLKILTELE